jgi:hypothetical protein
MAGFTEYLEWENLAIQISVTPTPSVVRRLLVGRKFYFDGWSKGLFMEVPKEFRHRKSCEFDESHNNQKT